MPDDLFGWTDGRKGPKLPFGQLPTSADRQEVQAMAADGIRRAEIAKTLGISVPTLRKYFATELKLRRGRPTWHWTPTVAERQQIQTMAADGVPVIDIAKSFSITEPTLRKYCTTELDTGRGGPLQRQGVRLPVSPSAAASADRDQTREVLDAVNGIKAQMRAQTAWLAQLEQERRREREHVPIILRKLTELERLVRGDPGLAKRPKTTRRHPHGVPPRA